MARLSFPFYASASPSVPQFPFLCLGFFPLLPQFPHPCASVSLSVPQFPPICFPSPAPFPVWGGIRRNGKGRGGKWGWRGGTEVGRKLSHVWGLSFPICASVFPSPAPFLPLLLHFPHPCALISPLVPQFPPLLPQFPPTLSFPSPAPFPPLSHPVPMPQFPHMCLSFPMHSPAVGLTPRPPTAAASHSDLHPCEQSLGPPGQHRVPFAPRVGLGAALQSAAAGAIPEPRVGPRPCGDPRCCGPPEHRHGQWGWGLPFPLSTLFTPIAVFSPFPLPFPFYPIFWFPSPLPLAPRFPLFPPSPLTTPLHPSCWVSPHNP